MSTTSSSRAARTLAMAVTASVAVTGIQVAGADSSPIAPGAAYAADDINPIEKTITVARGQIPKPEDGIANLKNLPEGTTVKWADNNGLGPDTSKPGVVKGTVLVTYADGTTSDRVTVTVNVRKDSETYTPQGTNISVDRTDPANARAAIVNIDELPTGTKFDWDGKAPDTSKPGTYDATVKVTYPDKSVDTVKIKVIVRPDNDIFEPKVRNLTTFTGTLPEAKTAVSNLGALREGTSVAWDEKATPDVSAPGEKTGKIIVTYPDGTVDTKNVKVNVYLSEGTYADLIKAIKEANGDLTDIDYRLGVAEGDIKRINKTIEQSGKDLDAVRDAVLDLAKNMPKDMAGTVTKVQSQIDDITEILLGMSGEIDHNTELIGKIGPQVETNRLTIRDNRNLIAEVTERAGAAEKMLDEHATALDAQEKKLEAQGKDIEAQLRMLKENSKADAALKQDLEAQKKVIAANKKAVGEHKKLLDEYKKAIDELVTRADEMDKRADGFDKQISAIDKRTSALETSTKTLKDRADNTDKEIKAIKKELSRLDGNDIVTAHRNADNSLTLVKKNGDKIDIAGINKYGLEKCTSQQGGYLLALLPVIAIAAPIVTQSALPNLDKQILAMQQQMGVYHPEVAKFVGDNRAAIAAGIATAALIGVAFVPGLCGDASIIEALRESRPGNADAADPKTRKTHELNDKGRWVLKEEAKATKAADADKADKAKDTAKKDAKATTSAAITPVATTTPKAA